MENIPSTMLIYKNVDGVDTIFSIMSGPLVNNPLGGFFGFIRRGTYQLTAEYRRWLYEPVSYLWPDIYTCSDSSFYSSSDVGRKDKDDIYDQ